MSARHTGSARSSSIIVAALASARTRRSWSSGASCPCTWTARVGEGRERRRPDTRTVVHGSVVCGVDVEAQLTKDYISRAALGRPSIPARQMDSVDAAGTPLRCE